MGTYIALTGGIAAGKTTVARRFSELGAVVIDADQLARAAVDPGSSALVAIEQKFGAQVIGHDGRLDRAALAAVVFGDHTLLNALNRIVHPAVQVLVAEAKRAAYAANSDAIIVYDIPLMLPGDAELYDKVVVVIAPVEQRYHRLVTERGMTPEDARRRIDSQPSADDLREIANVIIDSSISVEDTLRQADEAWYTIRAV